jgi:hypothetical protein
MLEIPDHSVLAFKEALFVQRDCWHGENDILKFRE